jgi:predicted nucleic acid-binding protein
MKVSDAFIGTRSVFLDTAPLIYHVERHPAYVGRTRPIFQRIDAGSIEAVTSSISLVECLVVPLRRGDTALATRFRDAITTGVSTRTVGLDAVAEHAAELRATLNLGLADAFQVACALHARVDAFITNDRKLLRAPGLRVLVLDDLDPG